MTLAGKVALVTGAGGGIGGAVSLALECEGVRVALVGRDRARLENVRSGASDPSRVAVCRADVTSSVQMAEAYECARDAFGQAVSIVFNAAGVTGRVGHLQRETEENFDAVFATNVKGTWTSLRVALPILQESGGGVIVNCASAVGIVGSPGLTSYAAAKHAVIGMTKSLAVEVARHGIRVNAICPGPTDTPMLQDLRDQRGDSTDHGSDSLGLGVPHVADPAEIARAVLFLISPASRSITGAVLTVDGGVSAGRIMTSNRH